MGEGRSINESGGHIPIVWGVLLGRETLYGTGYAVAGSCFDLGAVRFVSAGLTGVIFCDVAVVWEEKSAFRFTFAGELTATCTFEGAVFGVGTGFLGDVWHFETVKDVFTDGAEVVDLLVVVRALVAEIGGLEIGGVFGCTSEFTTEAAFLAADFIWMFLWSGDSRTKCKNQNQMGMYNNYKIIYTYLN